MSGKTSRRRPDVSPFTNRNICPAIRLATREAAMAAFAKSWRRVQAGYARTVMPPSIRRGLGNWGGLSLGGTF
jgi:hypothetical protein